MDVLQPSFLKTNESSVNNAEILAVLDGCDSYAKNHLLLKKHLSDGIFNLSKSRKNGALVASADDMRDEFDATFLVEQEKEYADFEKVELEGDSILLLSGMPPPALKIAQKDFRNAVDVVLELARLVQTIRRDLDAILV